ncbi:bidirectional sugar transporter SWEET3b [Elaeis guineensis]|uniref:Bidirectional sugar transporter SWEET n=1 Tax=Elaeis guineensis var. tenera TaxID=51953 RepID=A0A6I9RGN6_ELAGV|nr:bidirectional sugar transporter SWEET3b isoform X2 [Elaeis guineensis]
MGDTLRVTVGIMANAASLLLYAAPIPTFKRMIRKRSTEEFSCVPYILALMNCLLYTWYGLPIVSQGWENFPVITINGLGIPLETSFIFIYIWFSVPEQKKFVSLVALPVLVLFTVTAFVSSFVFHDHHHRKVFVGSIGLVASISMYSSPLVAVKQVIKTKSVEFMPFYLSFFSFIASCLWMAYGLLGRDLFLATPNLLGSPIALLQLVLYCMYRKGKEAHTETNKVDLEKDGAKFATQLQEVHEKKLEN